MSRPQEAMGTAESAWHCAGPFQRRDSLASDAARSSRDYQFETDWLGRCRAAAISYRVREFARERRKAISNYRRFLVASGQAYEPRTKFGPFGLRWAQQSGDCR